MKTIVTSTVSIFILAITCSVGTAAIVIDFETPTYSSGDLNGQDGWSQSNGSGNLDVGAAVGNPGAGLSWANAGTTAFEFYKRDVTNLEFGATFDNSSSIVGYSFDYFNNDFNGANTDTALSFAIGGDSAGNGNANAAAFFSFRGSGQLRMLNSTFGTQSDGTDFALTNLTGNVWNTISGEIDYANEYFTVFVNGSQVMTSYDDGNGAGNIAFHNTSSSNLGLYLGVNQNNGNNWASGSLDNISVSAVPEPSTAMLLGLGFVSLFMLRRYRK